MLQIACKLTGWGPKMLQIACKIRGWGLKMLQIVCKLTGWGLKMLQIACKLTGWGPKLLQIACGKRWRMVKEKERSRRGHRSHRSHTSQEPKATKPGSKKEKNPPRKKNTEKNAFPLQLCAGLRSQYASFVGQHAVVRELSSSTSYWVCFMRGYG